MSEAKLARHDRNWTGAAPSSGAAGDWQQWAAHVGEFGDLAQEAAEVISQTADKERSGWKAGLAIAAVIAVGLGALWLSGSNRGQTLSRISRSASRLGSSAGHILTR